MREISVFEAKTHFSGLIEHVFTQHEEVVITRRGEKIVKIIPFEATPEHDIATTLQEMQKLSDEIGTVKVNLKMIKQMKEEGRK